MSLFSVMLFLDIVHITYTSYIIVYLKLLCYEREYGTFTGSTRRISRQTALTFFCHSDSKKAQMALQYIVKVG